MLINSGSFEGEHVAQNEAAVGSRVCGVVEMVIALTYANHGALIRTCISFAFANIPEGTSSPTRDGGLVGICSLFSFEVSSCGEVHGFCQHEKNNE